MNFTKEKLEQMKSIGFILFNNELSLVINFQKGTLRTAAFIKVCIQDINYLQDADELIPNSSSTPSSPSLTSTPNSQQKQPSKSQQ